MQADLMLNSKSDKVKCDAANSLLNHLKPPEVKKIELDVGMKEDSVLASLRKTTMELVAAQRLAIQSGVHSAEQVGHSKVITVDEEGNVL